MATHVTCDYCGEPAETEDSFRMRLDGSENGHFYYWRGADLHPDCWRRVKEGLDLVMEAGGSLERIPTQGDGTTNSSRKSHKNRHDAYEAWKRLELSEREPFILEALANGQLTVSEICEAIRKNRSEFYVYEGTIRPLLKRMIEAGRIDRKPEDWRGKVRYRYFVTQATSSDKAAS